MAKNLGEDKGKKKEEKWDRLDHLPPPYDPRDESHDLIVENKEEGEGSAEDWLERLRKNMQQYSGIDPGCDAGQELLQVNCVTKAWPDTKKKLEKLEDWHDCDLNGLLREAQKVYVRRDDEKQRAKTKLMVATVEQVMKQQPEREREKEKSYQIAAKGPVMDQDMGALESNKVKERLHLGGKWVQRGAAVVGKRDILKESAQ
ncbi:hypothetical protein llap_7405 [Limosa lapponica baueri]|uniref:Core shell protein Gag P30 domain-containing protein n=1 Tax=Limosa lapponica baueri TaxID=1758121 RepID=A0A2I0U8B4_LIMLA|nr:hypothetical protein llap_7405 [Limosa lapponica baueri]